MKRPSPLANAVARTIRAELAGGAYRAGAALPPERELAEKHGVSRTVVREAVATLARDGLLVLRDRCRPVVAEPSGRPVRAHGPRHLAIWLWPYAEDYIASSIFRGIQRAARGSHVRLVMATASHTSWEEVLDSEARYIQGLATEEHIDGAILWYLGGEQNLPALIEAKRHGVRFVFIDRRPPEGIDADFVGTENVTSARNVVSHLIDLGHRRIAFVANVDPVSTVVDRGEGYRRALEEIGQTPLSEYMLVNDQAEGELEPVAVRRTAERILALSPKPTAVFAVNDVLAFGLVEAFQNLGVRVPEDISVAGFDGLLRWVPGGGHITTAVQNFTRIGELAAETLLNRIRSPESPAVRHILLDAPVFVGASTAAPPAEKNLNG